MIDTRFKSSHQLGQGSLAAAATGTCCMQANDVLEKHKSKLQHLGYVPNDICVLLVTIRKCSGTYASSTGRTAVIPSSDTVHN